MIVMQEETSSSIKMEAQREGDLTVDTTELGRQFVECSYKNEQRSLQYS